ncbi:MAG TPA: ligase-associated DNA damage response exonuclease [Bryobacteraceae bacterium]|nr:ligase-associated DNA damage response exonuclease [Bryobacteraceae bacterium]
MPLLRVDQNGLFCEAGGFYIDPWGPVDKALITHGHSDHARSGCAAYLCARPGELVLRTRLGAEALVQTLPYGETLGIGEVTVTFFPAGHVLGSAQIRVEHRGEVWVISGDYKLAADSTCAPFETARCHTFVTESTFGLPIYRWPAAEDVLGSINDWWRANRERGKCSVIFGYPLGKSQRVLAGLDPEIGPIFCHGAVERMNRVYRESGVPLPPTLHSSDAPKGYDWTRALVIAPPSAHGSPWMKRFGTLSTGLASGWMRIRGTRRRRSIDRGFVLSDHADWPGLQTAILESHAETVLVTHGYRAPLVRWLREQGKQAAALETRFEGEGEQAEDPVGDAPE